MKDADGAGRDGAAGRRRSRVVGGIGGWPTRGSRVVGGIVG